MARKTRRSRKYTWFPTIGTASGPEPTDNFNGRSFSMFVPGDGSTRALVSALVPDAPLEGDEIDYTKGGQLVQALGQEYFLRRIVGKVFIANTTNWTAPADNSPAVIVGVGFFVARVADASAGGPDIPIGATSPINIVEEYNPLSEDCIREPWIWRRTWVLGNPLEDAYRSSQAGQGMTVSQAGGSTRWPGTTAGYGSVADGGHVDAKTGRRVGNDDRLWVAVAARSYALGELPFPEDSFIDGTFDLRFLGALRKAHNRSTF